MVAMNRFAELLNGRATQPAAEATATALAEYSAKSLEDYRALVVSLAKGAADEMSMDDAIAIVIGAGRSFAQLQADVAVVAKRLADAQSLAELGDIPGRMAEWDRQIAAAQAEQARLHAEWYRVDKLCSDANSATSALLIAKRQDHQAVTSDRRDLEIWLKETAAPGLDPLAAENFALSP